MRKQVILLNNDYSFLSFITWKRALRLVLEDRCEVVLTTDRKVTNIDKTVEFLIPKVVRLMSLVKVIYKNYVPFSRKNVLLRDKYTCAYCGYCGDKKLITIDHVIPRSKGGKDTFENCVACCVHCNERKGDKLLEDINMYLRRKPYNPTVSEFMNLRVLLLPEVSSTMNDHIYNGVTL